MRESRSSSWEWRTSPALLSSSYSWALLASALWELVQVRSLFIPLFPVSYLRKRTRRESDDSVFHPSLPCTSNIRLTYLSYLHQGTLAAAFQSAFYGAFVPAGGLFATLTSMGMLGTLTPLFLGLAAVAAAVFTGMVWKFCGAR